MEPNELFLWLKLIADEELRELIRRLVSVVMDLIHYIPKSKQNIKKKKKIIPKEELKNG